MAKITRTAVAESAPEEDYEDSGYDNDEYEETSSAPSRSAAPSRVSSGWGAPREERRERVSAPYINFNKQAGTKILKVLDDSPIAHWFQHFFGPGQMPSTCLRDECPFCEKGYKATETFRLNVVDMEGDTEEVMVWDITWNVKEQLLGFIAKKPLNDPGRYFQVSYTPGKGQNVSPMSRDMMEEEYDLYALTDQQLAALEDKRYNSDTVFVASRKMAEERAARMPVYVAPEKKDKRK